MTLDIIEVSFFATKGISRFTAPTKQIYDIKGFVIVNRGTAANDLIVSGSYVEEQMEIISIDYDPLFVMALNTTGNNFSINLPGGIRRKHLSIGPRVDVNITATILVYYELKPATTVELIWEFIRRGKQP